QSGQTRQCTKGFAVLRCRVQGYSGLAGLGGGKFCCPEYASTGNRFHSWRIAAILEVAGKIPALSFSGYRSGFFPPVCALRQSGRTCPPHPHWAQLNVSGPAATVGPER